MRAHFFAGQITFDFSVLLGKGVKWIEGHGTNNRFANWESHGGIKRNGETMAITGWRAWLIGAAVVVGITLIIGLIAFLLLDVPITVGTALLIVVPVAVGVAILASLVRSSKG